MRVKVFQYYLNTEGGSEMFKWIDNYIEEQFEAERRPSPSEKNFLLSGLFILCKPFS